MEMQRSDVGVHDIETHLEKLGGGNREDDLNTQRDFSNFFLVSLS